VVTARQVPPPPPLPRVGTRLVPPLPPVCSEGTVLVEPAEYRVLGLTLMGRKGGNCREENQDAMVERRLEWGGGQQAYWMLAVADGVTRCPNGGGVARYLVERHLANDVIEQVDGGLVETIQWYLRGVNEQFYEEFAHQPAMLESACTLSIGVLEQSRVHCFWVGDSPIYLARRGEAGYECRQLTQPDVYGRLLVDGFGAHAPFEVKHCGADLRVGDLLVVATDGVSDSVEEFDRMLKQYGSVSGLLGGLEAEIRTRDYYDDATLWVAERLA
jgi:serine/threonine protein phosphatase PrpC